MSNFLRLLTSLLCACSLSAVQAAPTVLAISGATKGTSKVQVTMSFAVTRTGDLGFAAILNYHTVDGTAVAGTDYTATTGQLVVPAGAASATIPITLAANTGTAADSAFQVQLDSTLGVGPVSGFAAQQTFATGTSPYAVEYADINGDGKPDLIVANFNDNTVSVLLNTTAPGAVTPTFALQQTFATGANPDSIEVADVNGDGKPDLIVANNGSNTVSVLLNTTPPGAAMPSFATQQTFPTGSNPRSVAVADVNGDGKSDLIVSNLGDNTVSVLLNTTPPGAATPSFAAQQTFSTGSGLFFVAVADVNGDGRPDLIVPNSSAKTVSVLLNTTPPGAVTPTFAAQQ
ncbi:MAG: FG-GAP-like repeat-containing protein, partial [Rudaea sp.]